jgi:hypothetical protein
VVAGLEVVDKIAQASVSAQGDFGKVPVQAVVIESVTQIR